MPDSKIDGVAEQGKSKVIGQASATEREPNSSEKFCLWLATDEILNPFDIVEAEQMAGTRTFGLVTNIKQVTDAPSHLANYISSDFGNPAITPQTPRQGVNVAEVNVLANYDPVEPKRYPAGIYMPVQNGAPVSFAVEAGIHIALGIDKMFEYEKEHRERVTIPAGLIQMSNGTRARVFLDKRYVLGPEGAHINIAGISGLATKTSYAMFLIQSILQSVGAKDIAVILLNVKQNDLLVIDRPRRDIKPEQLEMWDYLGLQPQPFTNVRYLLPWGKQTQTTGMPNCFGEPPDQFHIYAYSLEDVVGNRSHPGPGLGLLIRVPDPWDTLGALVGEIQQGIMNGEKAWQNVRTWNNLLNGPPLMDKGIPQKHNQVAASSVGRFIRILRRVVVNHQSGLFVEQRSPRRAANLGEEIRQIQGGQTVVVDIANLTDEERSLVFGHIIKEVYGMYAEATIDERHELPRKVIIFVDELNKYAPARRSEGESSVIEYVLDIAARGRSLGVVLISAEQFMSEVHPQVIGNCATRVIGRSDASELSDPAYRFIPQDIKAHLTRLDKGELLLSHPIYRQPVKIEFPIPAYQAIGHEHLG
ncbi:ATP-binding protein [Moorella sulfitireducens]|uniref:ATP-binding protein n=1 Tax=Neomoorella sulfitireducens TaxID=2972948 RepID=UPI0021ABF185|nr:ATP-binding protein [Moorella sulfitireducens]